MPRALSPVAMARSVMFPNGTEITHQRIICSLKKYKTNQFCCADTDC